MLERERLKALRSLRVLDTAPETSLDQIAALAADLLKAPLALISLVDEERQWFKARVGLDVCSTPRAHSFCAHALELGPHAVMVVEDAAKDPRFADNPLVLGPPHIRFYAGALLTDPRGHNLGTLCVLDAEPRKAPSQADLGRLKILAEMVVNELRRASAERTVLEQRRVLALAEATSGVGHWRYEVNTREVTWSDEIYRIHGVSRGDFNPNLDDAISFYRPDGRPRLAGLIQQAVADGSGYQTTSEIRRPDGEYRDLLSKATCELDESGEVSALFGVCQDVTDQNRVLDTVQKSEARYRLLADHVADVITRFSLDGADGYVSPSVKTLLGYQPAEMAKRPIQAFVCKADQRVVLRAIAALRAGQEEATVQVRATHRDGRPIWVEVRARPVRERSGRTRELVAVVRDIAERKALEAELRCASEVAEAATAVKSEFLANMSHELRTPLTSIIGFTGLALARADMSDTTRGYIRKVEEAGRALLRTVNDVLDFSKLEAGQVVAKPEPTNLVQLCRASLDMFTPQASAKQLRLNLELNACPEAAVCIDPDRVRQVLLNLLGNAVKFTARGAVTLEVRYDWALERVRVTVHDTGPGVPADKVHRLFRRFSQVDGSLTRAHGGTGLGLAICKGLVEAMAGEIGADTALGQGSRFWFELPAAFAEARPAVLSLETSPRRIERRPRVAVG